MKKKTLNELEISEIEKIKQKQMQDIRDKEKDAREILNEVKKRGDEAIIEFTKKFDNVGLDKEDLVVKDQEIENAYQKVDEETIEALNRAAENIAIFQSNFLPDDLRISEFKKGIKLGYKVTSLNSVGCYVPGGKATYPSSALMTAIPAKIAGVNQVNVTTPPSEDGSINPATLVACDIAGVDIVYKIGGVQAIASLAYGTKSVDRVQKIVGPGGAYVSAAKNLVKKEVEIDMVAGPSEITIIADETSEPKTVAMDLLAQAEHGPDSLSLLLTNSSELAKKALEVVNKKLKNLNRRKLVKKSLDRSMIIEGEKRELFDLANKIAPEHLEIMTKCPLEDLDYVQNAGAIFLGKNSPVAIGDYATGCNHVLPTAGLAKTNSGLSVDDFLKKSSVQYMTKQGLSEIRDIGEKIAEIEDLISHRESIKSRFWEENQDE
ncbi:histidinol dehydrogenase [archaeon SCG-AAA382B04]|nr:histidinol dehydrogenase [archaeon SCG-AAA382B04]